MYDYCMIKSCGHDDHLHLENVGMLLHS